jgi:hypothetical protein
MSFKSLVGKGSESLESIGGFSYNFQSGFSNLNNIADSIGSFFGMGPEDRDSVTARGYRDLEKFSQQVLNSISMVGIEQAIKTTQDKIASEKVAKRKMKSANSKHLAQLWIDNLPKLLTELNKRKSGKSIKFLETNTINYGGSQSNIGNSPTSLGGRIIQNSAPEVLQSTNTANNSTTMMLGLGVLLLFAKVTKIIK